MRSITGIGKAVWLLAGLLLTPGPEARAVESLHLAISDANPIYANDRQTGLVDRLAQAVFDRLHLAIHIHRLPSARALMVADMGLVDGDLLRIAGLSQTYPRLVQVPEPWLEMGFGAFVRQPDLTIATWQDLQDLDVAFIRGWRIFEQNVLQARSVTRVARPENLFAMLKLGRVQAILYDFRQGEQFRQELDLPDAHPAGPALITAPVYLYLHRRHQHLAEPVAASLRAMKQDGQYARIMASPSEARP